LSPRSLEGFVDEPSRKDVLLDRDHADILREGTTTSEPKGALPRKAAVRQTARALRY